MTYLALVGFIFFWKRSARYVIVVLFGKIISKRFPMYISIIETLCIFLALNQFHSYSFNVTCDNFEQYLVIFETNCFSICDTGLPTDTCKELFAQKSIKVMRIINRTICS